MKRKLISTMTFAFMLSVLSAVTITANAEESTETTESSKKIVGWRCKICGYEYQGPELPPDFLCPLCGHPAEDFERVG